MAIHMDGKYMKRLKKRHGGQVSDRLRLNTLTLAKLFNVKPDTIRHWLFREQLVLTGDPVEDFITLARLARDKGLLD